MRFIATLLSWLIATALLAVTVPTVWAHRNVVDADGYTALAAHAAADPALQAAAAGELSTQAMRLIRDRGYTVSAEDVHGIAAAYTAGPAFPAAFAQANRVAHGWLFTNGRSGPDPLVVDLTPMLNDSAFQQMLSDYGVRVPSTVTVPLTESTSNYVQPGRLRPVAVWGPWVCIASVGLTAVFALLTLVVARSRGRALAGLGVSALLVGAAGWASIEAGRRYLGDALAGTAGDIRRIADTMVDFAEADLHHWLNLTLAGGGALVVFGVMVATLGGLRKPRKPR